MSGMEALPLVGSLLAGSGAIGAGTGATSAIPSLMAGSLMSSAPSIAPGLLSDAFSQLGMAAPAAIASGAPSIAPGILAAASLGSGSASIPEIGPSLASAFTYDPAATGITGSSIGATMPSDPTIDPLTGRPKDPTQKPSWMTAAGLGTADVLKSLATKQQPRPAPEPKMAPPNAVPVRLGAAAPAASRISPLQRYAMMLKSF